MPNAKLEYKLPDEQHEFDLATKAGDYLSAVHDIVQMLREETKYKDYATEAESKLAWEFRDKVWSILDEYKIDPYQ